MSFLRTIRSAALDRDATVLEIIDQAITGRPDGTAGAEAISSSELVEAARAYGIVLTPEDAATRIYTRVAHRGQ